MVSIPRTVRRIKDDLATLISPTLILSLCAQLGHAWRDGPLNPVTAVQLFILQVLHGNTAIQHLRHLIARTLALPLRTHEMAHAPALHEALEPGDVLAGDRAFSLYVHLALVLQRNLHAVFRVHQRMIVSFKPGRAHAQQ